MINKFPFQPEDDFGSDYRPPIEPHIDNSPPPKIAPRGVRFQAVMKYDKRIQEKLNQENDTK